MSETTLRRSDRLHGPMLDSVERRLLERYPAAAADPVSQVEPEAIATVADAALLPGDALERQLATFRLRHRLCVEGVMLRLLAPASRELGRRWTADTVGFPDVTLGVLRMRDALRRLLTPAADLPTLAGRRIALWAVPGEQHRFGTAMLAAIFRRRGWTVIEAPVARADDIVRQVRLRRCALVGLSIGSERLLPTLRDCTDAARRGGAAVMVGGPLLDLRPDLAAVVGADAAAADAPSAVAGAEQLLRLRRRGAGVPPIVTGSRIAAGWIG